MQHPFGRFMRNDLMTHDAEACLAFYTAMFGWTHRDILIEGYPARILLHAGRRVGVLISLREPWIPAHWQAMVAVEDVHAVAARAEARGFAILEKPLAIPNHGTFTVIADRRHGLVAAMELDDPASVPKGPPPIGGFCWCELQTRDAEAAVEDYRAVFGWQAAPMPGPKDPTWIIGPAEGPQSAVGTVMQKRGDVPAEQRDFWMSYIAVEDCAASAAKAVALGGEQRVGPTVMSGMGTFAVLADPGGAEFAIWQKAG